MKTGAILGIIAAVLVAGALTLVVTLVGINNSFVRMENGVVAVHEDMKNVHASIFNKIKSQGLVVEKYGEMVIGAINAAISGRYGASGAQAAFLAIKEQNPTIDSKIMEKLQVAIEAGYNGFESAQRGKIDRLRVYDNALESVPGGWLARTFMGFPRKVTADMRTTISSAETKETFQTKEMKTIDPFAKR
jgi:hypothetical protein